MVFLACAAAGHVRGEKSAMIAHLIGTNACRYASKEAKMVARKLWGGSGTNSDPETPTG